eukprot:Nk52_evm16s152 gene=Nk52_evmTU16s152
MSNQPKQQYPSGDLSHLLPTGWKQQISDWLKEDIPSFDYGGYVVGESSHTAVLYAKSNGVLAGCPFFEEVFTQLQCRVEWEQTEGAGLDVSGGKIVCAKVYGSARNLLLGERTALNILARCSGIAKRCRHVADLKAAHGFKGVVAATRKTTPGFRLVEKYGVLVGGCDGHRMDLSSMVMLKDNHIWSCGGSITSAVHKAKEVSGFSLKIEVECQDEKEAQEAIEAGADIVMLDNFQPEELKAASARLKAKYGGGGECSFLVEASGGVTEETVSSYFGDAVDIISMGSLIQGVGHVDFSLKIQQKG